MARITSRLLVYTFLLLALLYLLFHTASYGLTREAQFESLRKKFGHSVQDDAEPQRALTPEEDLTIEIPKAVTKVTPSQPPVHIETQHTTVVIVLGDDGKPIATDAAQPPSPSQSSSSPPKFHDSLAEMHHAPEAAKHADLGMPPPAPIASSATSSSEPTAPAYSKALVIARTKAETGGTAWLSECERDDSNLRVMPYTVDDPTADYHVPKNKGHEAMVYLTYIIDHYDEIDAPLADVSLFMHAHKLTWHNNDLLDSSSVNIVKHLQIPKVLRDGYFNLRCHLDPGCPAHLHPSVLVTNPHRPEETEIVHVWPILFPGEPVPDVLSQPCCSQFALSRDRILSLPKSQYETLRDWLATTPLPDVITGRIFEYVWQKIWTGQNEFCPIEHVCYCEGYGICFGNATSYDLWFERRKEFRELSPKLQRFVKLQEEQPSGDWLHTEEAKALRKKMEDLRDVLGETKDEAMRRGRDERLRAEEVDSFFWRDAQYSQYDAEEEEGKAEGEEYDDREGGFY